MKITITHLWPESNSGDDAIVQAMVEIIKKKYNEAQICGITTYDTHTENIGDKYQAIVNKGVKLYPGIVPGYQNDNHEKLNLLKKYLISIRLIFAYIALTLNCIKIFEKLYADKKQTLDLIKSSEVVVVKGGALIMAPTPKITSTLYILRNLMPIYYAVKVSKKVVIAPHSFGPFLSIGSRVLLRNMLRGVKLIAREEISINILKEIGLKSTYCPDMAFYFAENKEVIKKELIILTVRPCPTFRTEKEMDDYYSKFVCVFNELRKIYTVKFLPQVTGPDEREDDRVAIGRILNESGINESEKSKYMYDEHMTLRQKIDTYRDAKLCIGTRMHSIILTMCTGGSVIAISYLGPKHAGIMMKMGLEACSHDYTSFDENTVVEQAKKIMSGGKNVHIEKIQEEKKKLEKIMDEII